MKQVTKASNNKNAEQGFSLLETAIALCIMMVITLATGSLYVYATNYNAGSADRAAALALAQQRMERLRRTPYTDATLNTGSTTEIVSSAGRNYSVTTTICTTSGCGGSSTLKVITVQVAARGVSLWANAPVTVVSERAAPTIGSYVSY